MQSHSPSVRVAGRTTPATGMPPLDTVEARRTSRAPEPKGRPDVPVLVYRGVVAVIVGLTLTGPAGAIGLLAPWSSVGHAGDQVWFELHRWHVTDVTALVSLLMAGTLVASAFRPRTLTLLVQAYLAGALMMAAIAPLLPDPSAVMVPVAMMTVPIVAGYPRRRQLLHLQGRFGRRGVATVASVLATPLLALVAWENLQRQLGGTGEHADLGHWAGAAGVAVAILVIAWLTTTAAAGARTLSMLVGLTGLYLGAAALTLPNHDGSWSSPGGVAALVLAALFLGSALRPLDRGEARS